MEPDRWQRIERLYHTALEQEPGRREVYLREACGSDQSLLREVESLLAHEEHAQTFIQEPALHLAAQDLAAQSLDLTVGQTLGRYRILSLVGSGGMGIVYTAHDSRLGRTVALKFLSSEFIGDGEALERFRREARALSALNHPNICTIYDTAEAEGRTFIAMEYVAGQRLDRRIGRKGLPLKEALKFAVQIADALAKAHGSGVIHRDLKPGNIMVRDDGHIKLLDFGLAKLTNSSGIENSASTTQPGDVECSTEGAIVGTVAYMSPEQAAGKKLDARSDIFSFGAVLHEMITGRRAFPGVSSISTLSAILHDDPVPATQISPGLPADADKVIRRCLRKDPERRFQSAADLKVVLHEMLDELESGKLAGGHAARRSAAAPVVAIAAALLLTAASIIWILRRPVQSQRPTLVIRHLTSDPGLATKPALSQDGKLVAYASDRSGADNLDIWDQQVAGGPPNQLTTNTADDTAPDFSPDGSRIAFLSARDGGGIYVISTLGGEERLVVKSGAWTSAPRFSPDGNWIAYSIGVGSIYSSRTYIVSSTGGTPREFEAQIPWTGFPIWSPDGRHLLFVGNDKPSGLPPFDWWVAPAQGGRAVKTGAVSMIESNGLKLESPYVAGPSSWKGNRIIFFAQSGNTRNLWQVAINPRTWQVENGPERLTTGAGQEVDPSVSADGQLVFATTDERLNLWILPIDANSGKAMGKPQALTQSAANNYRPSLSSDGRKLIFESARSGNIDIWMRDMESGKERALTATPWNETHPTISLDGSKVVYASENASSPVIHVLSTENGAAEKICDDCGMPMGWSPDGRSIYYYYWESAEASYASIDLATRQRMEIIHHPKYNPHMLRFFPNGNWLTFHMPVLLPVLLPEARSSILIAPVRDGVAAGENEWIPITDGAGIEATPWSSPDGSILYFLSKRDGFQCIWAQHLDPLTKRPKGLPFAVSHFHGARYKLRQNGFGPGISAAKLIFTMSDSTGNIWITKIEPPR